MHIVAEQAENDRAMERATPAGIVATAMGFLADFLVLREGQTNVDLSEFVDWLRRHDHRELAQRILSDPAILNAFERAFTEGHGEIATKLEFLDEGLILLCGTEGILAEVARSLRPDLAAKVHGR